MTGLEKITERIKAEAKEKARGILLQAEQDCRGIAQEYAERAEATRERIKKESLARGEALIARSRTEAANTEREIVAAARAEMLDRAFALAGEELRATDYGKYRELLTALLVSALLEQDRAERESLAFGDEVESVERLEVVFNAEDREKFGKAVLDGARKTCERRIGAQKANSLCLSGGCAEIDGGLILRFGDVELNCSLAVLLADIRNELEGKVAALLFAEQDKQ